jgi:polysaccharide pyruvyl transferase WcaK-like protein
MAILCEGSTLKSKFANALTLYFCEAAGIMKEQGKPCMAYGSEAGEMDHFLEKLVKELCSDIYFIARTQASLDRIARLGIKGYLGTDTAWTFDSTSQSEQATARLKESGWDGVKPILGIAVINPFWWPVKPSVLKTFRAICTKDWTLHFRKWYFFSWSGERKRLFDNYLTGIARAVDQFAAERNLYPVIIGMEMLDSDACVKLQKQMATRTPVFLASEQDGYVLTEILRSLSILITSRYHAQVLSMDSKVPTVALSMDERLDNIFEELDFPEKLLFKVNEDNLDGKILKALEYIELNKGEIQDQIEQKLPYYFHTMAEMGNFCREFVEKSFPGIDLGVAMPKMGE